MAAKQLRVGMIGDGFMGRAHSNAYRQVGKFFDLPYDVTLQAVHRLPSSSPAISNSSPSAAGAGGARGLLGPPNTT